MERESPPPPRTAVDIIKSIETNYARGPESMDMGQFWNDIASLRPTGVLKTKECSLLTGFLGQQPDIATDLATRFKNAQSQHDQKLSRHYLEIAHVLGLQRNFLEEKSNRPSKRQIALALIALGATATSLAIPAVIVVNRYLQTSVQAVEADHHAEISSSSQFGQPGYYELTERTPTPSTSTVSSQPKPSPTAAATEISRPAIEQRILHPKELSYPEVKRWIGQLRNSHDQILSEPLFAWEIARLPEDKRNETLRAIAQAHAKALIEHYGNTETLIGLDPGHGGTDIGASGRTLDGKILAEKDLSWQLSQMIAEEIYQQTNGKYIVVFLRPENPIDEDLDRDGIIAPVERIQKRKALLMKTEAELHPNPVDRGKNTVYLSLHFNGSPDYSLRGTETYWPNQTGVSDVEHRDSSRVLAQRIQAAVVEVLRRTGFETTDRGAKADPDQREPGANSDQSRGQYIVLGSSKLDRDLKPLSSG